MISGHRPERARHPANSHARYPLHARANRMARAIIAPGAPPINAHGAGQPALANTGTSAWGCDP
eukprot:9565602-Lingulodinium_polyedra.AAC.1